MIFFFLTLFVFTTLCIPLDYYLSPYGTDDGNGTQSSPWRTIQSAQNQVRTLRMQHGGRLPGPININFGSGIYYIMDTITFGSGDSGDSSSWVTYKGVSSGSVTISGGIQIKSWASLGNGKWSAQLPTNTKYIRQLWINGKRIPPSSTPPLTYVKLENPNNISSWIQYKTGDVQSNYNNLEDVEVVIYHSWTASIHKIKSIDTNNSLIYLQNPTNGVYDTASGNRYYLQNTLETLSPGTFYYDRTKYTVIYYGNPGEDPNKATSSIVPQLIELVSISGESSHPVQYVAFESLTFSHAMVDTSSCLDSSCDAQSASFLNTAAVHLNNAGFLNFIDVEISHVGGYALWLESECNSILVKHGHLWDLGAGGLRIGNPRGGIAPPGMLSALNTVNDSLIEDGGHYYQMGVGVFLQQTAKNIIAHNEIRYFRYTGVSCGWSWGYDATSNSDNFIGYNLIHHIGEGYLSDMGCVYNLGVSPGTQIYNNICHDVWSYNYGGWGLYTDEGSSQVKIANNIVYLTKCDGIHQHYGENNLFVNNIIAYSADHMQDEPHCNSAIRSSQWAPGSGKGDESSFTFRQNIVYIDQGTLFYSSNSIGFNNMTFDLNVYWSTKTGDNLNFPPTQHPTTFKAWQAEGKDVHSVLTDPLFVAPSSYDFRLQSNSPALKLGFVQIDTSQVGPRS